MKSSLLLSILLLSSYITFSQNLVVNPSFETTSSNCGSFGGEGFSTDLAASWNSANSNTAGDSCSSPDLFSLCNTLPGFGPTPTNMPNSFLGYQVSRTGTRHAGIITYEALGSPYREYIQGRTTTPLVAGQVYCVSMYVSLGNDVTNATNNIGVRFTNTQYMRDACTQGSLINLPPQLNYTCAPILDTANWVRLQWNYTAVGGEQYFIIGNFFNNAGTTVASTGVSSLNPYAYYYIDDVSIVPNSCCAADITPQSPLCISDAPVTLTAVPPLGASCTPSPITGTWSGPGMSAAGVFSPAVAGVGTHTIMFNLSCGGTATTTITVSPCVALVACVETNGSITASNGVAPYSWQNQTTTQDCSACILACTFPPGCAVNVTNWTTFNTGTTIPAPTTYPIRLIDNAGGILVINSAGSLPACTSNPCPTITINVTSQTPVGCGSTNNGTATVAASGGTAGYQYVWTPGNLIGATQNALSAQTYTVNVLDAANCTGSTTVTIGSSTTLSLTTQATSASCGLNNGSASVSVVGGSGTYTYAWSPSGGSAAITSSTLAPGTYNVTVTGGGCTGTASVLVDALPTSVVNVTSINHPTCTGGNNGSFVYTINGGTPVTSPAIFGPGLANVNVTDGNGCSIPVSVDFVLPVITATVNTVGANCGVSNGSATISPSGGTAPYTYAWSPSGGTAASATNLSSGAYSVLITDASGCTLTQAVNVPAIGGPTLTLSNIVNASCGLSNGSATVNATGGTAPYTYAWSPSGGNGQTATGLSAGNYTVTVTDNSGCVVSETATIGGSAAITISGTVTDENCGQSDGEIVISTSGGTGPFSFAWSPTGETTQNLSNILGGSYSVTATDANGCTASSTFEVEVVGSLPITVNPSVTTIEQGDTVQLTASGGMTYSWTPTTNLSCTTCDTLFAAPTSTTTYEVTATDANGCSGTQEVIVYVNPICSQEIFVPTIFSPNNDGKNDKQCVLGSCISTMIFSIYNRWGELVFETNDQNTCWDGTYKGKKVGSDVFVYKLNAILLNGKEVIQSGNLTVLH